MEPILPEPSVEDVKTEIVALALEDLSARTEALKHMLPPMVRRHVIAQQSTEILSGLISRRLPESGE